MAPTVTYGEVVDVARGHGVLEDEVQRTIELIDTWFVGDQLKTFEYVAHKLTGGFYDLTGYTGKLVGRSRDNRANTVDIACTFNNPPTDGVSIVASLGTILVLTPGRKSELYVCNFKWTRTSDAKLLKSPKFALAIELDPQTA